MIHTGALFENKATKYFKSEINSINKLEDKLSNKETIPELRTTMTEINKDEINHQLFRKSKPNRIYNEFKEVNKLNKLKETNILMGNKRIKP